MPQGSDPLGRRALFWAPGMRSEERGPEAPETSGRRAMFSPPAARRGTLVLACSSCGVRTRVTYAEFVRRHLPFWLWIPGRRFSRLLACPACSRRTWLEADFRG
jgi:hypothetical protein